MVDLGGHVVAPLGVAPWCLGPGGTATPHLAHQSGLGICVCQWRPRGTSCHVAHVGPTLVNLHETHHVDTPWPWLGALTAGSCATSATHSSPHGPNHGMDTWWQGGQEHTMDQPGGPPHHLGWASLPLALALGGPLGEMVGAVLCHMCHLCHSCHFNEGGLGDDCGGLGVALALGGS